MDQITSTKENIIFGPFLLNEKKGGGDHCDSHTWPLP